MEQVEEAASGDSLGLLDALTKPETAAMNTGKCPKCEHVLQNVRVEGMSIDVFVTPRWNGVSLICPYCATILGVGIDPIALKNDIVNAILRGKK